MRVEFDPSEFDIDLRDFAQHFSPIAIDFDMHWRLAQSDYRPRMAILVSKYDHCLVDLLYRHQSGELACEIPLIISNHPDSQPIADFYRIPFFCAGRQGQQARSRATGLALLERHERRFHRAGALHADSVR